jgi:hypothetical protein
MSCGDRYRILQERRTAMSTPKPLRTKLTSVIWIRGVFQLREGRKITRLMRRGAGADRTCGAVGLCPLFCGIVVERMPGATVVHA